MKKEVWVAGTGVISAIGLNRDQCLQSLRLGQAGMAKMQRLRSIHQDTLPVAEVKLSNEELAALSGLASTSSRTALLSAVAALEALADAGLGGAIARDESSGSRGTGIGAGANAGLEATATQRGEAGASRWRTGFISANSVGGMDLTEDFYPAFLADPAKGRLRQVVQHECGAATEAVADLLGINQYVSTISTACSSSANAIFFGARLIKHGYLDVVVAGGTDSLSRFTLNGFNTLMILDTAWCKPFDENRKGLNLGEGAGYVVLVSDAVAATLKRPPLARLSGYANANDAYHQTASSPDGTGSYMAMQGALTLSGLEPSDIDYINLHGTGTQNNDIAEGTAIKRLFEPTYPPMSSTKSFTGHTLGGCGGIEAVFSVLSLHGGYIYPNLRLETPMKELPFKVATTFREGQPINHVLSNSFGFGGNCTSLIFSKL
jgi:3-oxoacyl-[acyl-carrier-protein] synthase-1